MPKESAVKREVVMLGVANEGEMAFDVEHVEKWNPTNLRYFSDVVYFSVNGKYFSMRYDDFKKIFKK